MSTVKTSPFHLAPSEREVLSALEEHCGTPTKWIAHKISAYSSDRRRNSGIISATLKFLEARGLVGKLDADRPTAWTRTKSGTEALNG